MPLFTKDAIMNDVRYSGFKKIDHKALVKHLYYINTKRNGDATPKTRGRPFFSKTYKKKDDELTNETEIIKDAIIEEIQPQQSKKKSRPRKMNCVEKRRRAIELKLEKLNKRAAEFKASLNQDTN
tara:strand:+ start:15808 stop:16182 length:375 start_codon:yes stop_codon:yes gene_type:complete